MSADLLTLRGVSRSFGGLKAVQNVSLSVPGGGSLTALIGPNGAGKTTLFALMSGFLVPDAGQVEFDGADITGRPPHLNARAGLALDACALYRPGVLHRHRQRCPAADPDDIANAQHARKGAL